MLVALGAHFVGGGLAAELVLVRLAQVLPESIVALHVGDVALGDLHLLRRGCAASVLAMLALLSCAVYSLVLLVAGADHVDLLADFDWALADTEAYVAVTRGALPVGEDVLLVARALVEGVAVLEVHAAGRLVGRRGWKLGCDAHRVDRFLERVDLVQVLAFWRLLGGRVALIASADGLRIALDDHGLEGWHLLLVLGLTDVG